MTSVDGRKEGQEDQPLHFLNNLDTRLWQIREERKGEGSGAGREAGEKEGVTFIFRVSKRGWGWQANGPVGSIFLCRASKLGPCQKIALKKCIKCIKLAKYRKQTKN
jgi:hypothetical protein